MRGCVTYNDLWPWPISSRSFSLGLENRVRSVASTVPDGVFPYLVQMITSMRRCVACDDLWPWPISSRSFDLDIENHVRSVASAVLDGFFLPEASFGLRVLSLPVSVCVSVCPCGNHLLVRAITHHTFKLGSPNLDHRCKRPWLRSLLFWGVIDLDLQGQIWLRSQKLPLFELVGRITHHLFKLGSPNLGQRCKIPGLRFLLILGLIGLDLQFHFQFWNLFFYQTYMRCFCKYLVRPSPVYI